MLTLIGEKQSVAKGLKLIRGRVLLDESKEQALMSFARRTALIAVLLSFPLCVAQAQDAAPPSAAEVRAMVDKNETGPADEAPKPTEAAKSDAAPTADGISLEGIDPLSRATTDQLELERQAEEAAAKAAQEEEQREREHNQKSYKRASEGLLPLSTDQIRAFMEKLENTQEAAQPPHQGAPKGEVKVFGLSLDPGVEPPQVNLSAGYVTTIAIVDQTGSPWPILDVGVGGNFEVTPTQAGSHVVRVVPLTRYGDGNLSIMLKDLPTPIIFRLSAGGSTFHMRFDARVPKLGPMAKTPIIQRQAGNGLEAGDETISMILENAPPKDAKKLKIGGVDARSKAWRIGDKVYVRTPLTLLSPAWNASASSADGMTVYEIGEAPVLLLSDNGAMIRARLAQDESHD